MSIDLHRASTICRPRLLWSRIHRWGGTLLFGVFCFSAGYVGSTAYYKVTHLWHIVGSETSSKSATPAP